jgi:hypothetical protein
MWKELVARGVCVRKARVRKLRPELGVLARHKRKSIARTNSKLQFGPRLVGTTTCTRRTLCRDSGAFSQGRLKEKASSASPGLIASKVTVRRPAPPIPAGATYSEETSCNASLGTQECCHRYPVVGASSMHTTRRSPQASSTCPESIRLTVIVTMSAVSSMSQPLVRRRAPDNLTASS